MKMLLTLLLLTVASSIHAADKPNVLLICVDDLKPYLGCYGDKLVKSPNIDRLAARSVLFERAYCNQAVCSPSRNALLVGLRPQSLGIYDLAKNFRKAEPDRITLPQFFKQQGWHTAGLGKIFHVGHGNTDDAASWSVPSWKPSAPTYAAANARPQGSERGAAFEAADVADGSYADGAVADEAIRRLQAARTTPRQPFFLAVGFIRPHLPFVAPQNYWDLYDRAAFKLAELRSPPADAPSYAPQFGGELRQYADVPKSGPLDDELQRSLIHGYYAAISYMDAQVGRVLDELDRQDFGRNTVIVLWGDHGWHLGDHGMWCKHTNYEQATRIPLMVSAPGMKAGVKSKSLVESADLYPTLCELIQVAAPNGLDGKSFAATLRNESMPTRDHAIQVYPRSAPDKGQVLGRAIRTERYRMVEWKKFGAPADSAEIELYDYETDPLESRNLAASQSEVVSQLRAILARHPEPKPQIAKVEPAATPAKPKVDRNKLFDNKDKNQDGKLTREEFLANQPDPDEAPERFVKFDVNEDGVLSRDEFVTSGAKKAEK